MRTGGQLTWIWNTHVYGNHDALVRHILIWLQFSFLAMRDINVSLFSHSLSAFIYPPGFFWAHIAVSYWPRPGWPPERQSWGEMKHSLLSLDISKSSNVHSLHQRCVFSISQASWQPRLNCSWDACRCSGCPSALLASSCPLHMSHPFHHQIAVSKCVQLCSGQCPSKWRHVCYGVGGMRHIVVPFGEWRYWSEAIPVACSLAFHSLCQLGHGGAWLLCTDLWWCKCSVVRESKLLLMSNVCSSTTGHMLFPHLTGGTCSAGSLGICFSLLLVLLMWNYSVHRHKHDWEYCINWFLFVVCHYVYVQTHDHLLFQLFHEQGFPATHFYERAGRSEIPLPL